MSDGRPEEDRSTGLKTDRVPLVGLSVFPEDRRAHVRVQYEVPSVFRPNRHGRLRPGRKSVAIKKVCASVQALAVSAFPASGRETRNEQRAA